MADLAKVAAMGDEMMTVLRTHEAGKDDALMAVSNVFVAIAPGLETPREVSIALMLERPLALITRLLKENAELQEAAQARKGKE